MKAVLFDLDDTLFDHRHSMRTGLAVLQKKYDCFSELTLDEFEQQHIRLMNEIHLSKILRGEITLEEGRALRFKRAFTLFGINAPDEIANDAADFYRKTYSSVTRLKPGAEALLKEIKKQYKTGIVTNNLIEEQTRKLKECEIEHLVDVMVTSEEAGVVKPDPLIFNMALERLDCSVSDVIMIGDSWEVDIMGAHKLGMRCIWVNTYNEYRICDGVAVEISSLEDTAKILNLINNHNG
ncbi:MAG TPA: HAD family hydrolase [Ignavibacteria bacterium]